MLTGVKRDTTTINSNLLIGHLQYQIGVNTLTFPTGFKKARAEQAREVAEKTCDTFGCYQARPDR